jgi:phospholipase/carboxylesterase
MMNTEKDIHEIGNWILRMRHPHDQEPSRLLLLLHGWTGDENSMWIFTPRVPDNYLVVSPRGMYPTSLGGYGWRAGEIDGWSKISDFTEAIEALLSLIDSEIVSYVAVKQFSLMGFSQGAALSYAMTLMYPQRIDKLLGISGFMPDGAEDYVEGEELQGKTAFVAHGRMDDIVPIKKARKVVNVLKQAGAEVTYCEDDVGHKLSSSCFRGLNHYLVRDS